MAFYWWIYIVGCVVSLRYIAGLMAYSNRDNPNAEDWMFGGIMGLLFCWAWPVCLFFMLPARFLPKSGPEKRALAARKQAELNEREISRLER